MLNLAVLLENSARRFPQRAAVVTGADSLTLSQLDATASQVAGLLRAVGVRPGDAVIIYTSGTTGQPKGVELSHSSLLLNALAMVKLFGSHPDGYDRFLAAQPLYHSGADLHDELRLRDGGDPGHASAVRRQAGTGPDGRASHHRLRRRADHVLGDAARAPRGRWALGTGRARPDLLRRCRPLPAEIIREVRERFGVQISEGYGLTESSPLVLFADPREE